MTRSEPSAALPSWPPTLLGWLLRESFPDQPEPEPSPLPHLPPLRWTVDAQRAAIEVRQEPGAQGENRGRDASLGRRLAAFQVEYRWPPPNTASPTAAPRRRALRLIAEVDLRLDAQGRGGAVPPALVAHLRRRGQRLARWLAALEKRALELVAPLFPRDAGGDGDIRWENSPLLGVGREAPRSSAGVYVKLGDLDCGLRCVFCTRGGRNYAAAPPALFLRDQLYRAALGLGWAPQGAGAGVVAPRATIGGDEPLGNPDLRSLVRLAHLRGFRPALQTSAVGITDPQAGEVARLAAAGLAEALLPVYGVTAATHDRVVGLPGHFDRLERVVRALRDRGVAVKLHTLALRLNEKELEPLLEWARERTGSRCDVLYPRDEGPSPVPVTELMVSLSALSPRVRQHMVLRVPCLDVGRDGRDGRDGPNGRDGLDGLDGRDGPDAPSGAASARAGQAASGRTVDTPGRRARPPGGPEPLADRDPAAERSVVGSVSEGVQRAMQAEHADCCAGCRLRPRCDGLPAGYLARFGDAELRPR